MNCHACGSRMKLKEREVGKVLACPEWFDGDSKHCAIVDFAREEPFEGTLPEVLQRAEEMNEQILKYWPRRR